MHTLVLFLLSSLQHQSRSPASFFLSDVRVAVPNEVKLGPKRAGLLCLPNGSIRLGRLNLTGPFLRGAVEEALSKTEISIATNDSAAMDGTPVPYRLVGTITSVRLSTCATGWGMGDRSSVKGHADVVVNWELASSGAKGHVLNRSVAGSADFPRPSGDAADLLASAVSESARSFIARPEVQSLFANHR
jgi:hypothetical protein